MTLRRLICISDRFFIAIALRLISELMPGGGLRVPLQGGTRTRSELLADAQLEEAPQRSAVGETLDPAGAEGTKLRRIGVEDVVDAQRQRKVAKQALTFEIVVEVKVEQIEPGDMGLRHEADGRIKLVSRAVAPGQLPLQVADLGPDSGAGGEAAVVGSKLIDEGEHRRRPDLSLQLIVRVDIEPGGPERRCAPVVEVVIQAAQFEVAEVRLAQVDNRIDAARGERRGVPGRAERQGLRPRDQGIQLLWGRIYRNLRRIVLIYDLRLAPLR